MAMPSLDGGPEPDYPPGVNQPDPWYPGRDDPDIEGEWNVLVILVDFEDYPWDNQEDQRFNNEGTPYDLEHFNNMLFSEYDGETGFAHPGSESDYTGSMRDYYTEVSGGVFTVTGLVTEWVRAPEPYSFYCNNDGEYGTDDDFGYNPYNQGIRQLVEDVLAILDDDVDYSDFDNDDDDVMDALTIVHAGPGAEVMGRNAIGANYFWSHKWNIRPQERDGVTISTYNTTPQDGTIGVFCHEFGHVLGLPDLYDIDYSSQGIGEWGLMAGGGWPYRPGDPPGSCPVHMCGWSKMELGWVDVVNIEQPVEDMVIPPVAEENVIYRVWTDGDDRSLEYFLLENRRQIGFDAGLLRRQIALDLPAPEGLLITHIDMNQHGMGNQDNADEMHRLVDVEEASPVWINGELSENLDRSGGSIRNLYNSNRGDNGDLWPGFSEMNEDSSDWVGERDRDRFGIFSVPSSASYEQSPSLVQVYDIRLDGENVIASINISAPDEPLLYLFENELSEGAGANDNGTVEPGEQGEWSITLGNLGMQDATGAYAILSYAGDDGLAEIIQDEIEFPDIPGEENRTADETFVIAVSEDAEMRSRLEFMVTVHSNDSLVFSYELNLTLTPPHEWYKFPGNPVLGGVIDAWDEGVISPAVIVEDEVLKCWYIGVADGGNDGEPPFGAIGYAVSEDGGVSWEAEDEPILSVDDVEWAEAGFGGIAVMQNPIGGYMMTFLAATDQQGAMLNIGIATSRDGIDWDVAGAPIVEPDGRIFSGFFPTQLSLTLYPPNAIACSFAGLVGIQGIAIGNAFSENGQDWAIDPELIIPPSGDMERFDAFAVLAPDVILDPRNEAFRVFYSGIGADETFRLGMLSATPEGVTYHDGVETGGSVLEADEDDWEGVDMIFGARYFEWEGEPRLLYVGVNDSGDEGGVAVGLAAPVPFDEQATPLSGGTLALPKTVVLESVYPNPFNSTSIITYRLPSPGSVTVSIHDIVGREVTRLVSELPQASGQHQAVWNGTDKNDSPVASGFYIVKVKSGNSTVRGKLLLVK